MANALPGRHSAAVRPSAFRRQCSGEKCESEMERLPCDWCCDEEYCNVSVVRQGFRLGGKNDIPHLGNASKLQIYIKMSDVDLIPATCVRYAVAANYRMHQLQSAHQWRSCIGSAE